MPSKRGEANVNPWERGPKVVKAGVLYLLTGWERELVLERFKIHEAAYTQYMAVLNHIAQRQNMPGDAIFAPERMAFVRRAAPPPPPPGAPQLPAPRAEVVQPAKGKAKEATGRRSG